MLGRCDCVWCLCYHVYSVIIYTNSNVTLCVCVLEMDAVFYDWPKNMATKQNITG